MGRHPKHDNGLRSEPKGNVATLFDKLLRKSVRKNTWIFVVIVRVLPHSNLKEHDAKGEDVEALLEPAVLLSCRALRGSRD